MNVDNKLSTPFSYNRFYLMYNINSLKAEWQDGRKILPSHHYKLISFIF